MSNDPNVYEYDPERAAASAKRIHDEARKLGLTNPAEAIYAPGSKVRILSKGMPEWEERQKRDEQWRKDHPPPPAPSIHYHVDPVTGDWEQRFATEEQLAERRKAQDVPLHKFKAVVDPDRKCWALKQGMFTKFFKSSDAVSRHCRSASKGERSTLEFYKAPGPIDHWVGDDFGDFINSESW